MASSSSSYMSPEYTHCLREARFRHNVYEPEADTFLFLEALDEDASLLRALCPRRCIEIGCGSGTVVTHLRCILMPQACAPGTGVLDKEEEEDTAVQREGTVAAEFFQQFCAVDVNPLALEATGITWTDTLRKHFSASVLMEHFRDVFHCEVPSSLAAVPVMVGPALVATTTSAPDAMSSTNSADPMSSPYCLQRYQGDLFDPVRASLAKAGPFDVILFNPPYVPTSLEELEEAVAMKDVITAAWCGGPRGRVVLDRFLAQLPSVLARTGVCYLVLIKENEIADVVACAQQIFCDHLRRLDASKNVEGDSVGDVLEAVEVAVRYTGEHLCVYRLRYLPKYQVA